jgi:class 3 adenylate cyclase
MAEFRREFSSEVLKPGVQLKVSRMGLFFSDLSDSTKLYAEAGDASAFRLVQDHFELLVPIIERHGGAVVKTIGDAIMAAFTDDRQGLAACREMLIAFERFRQEQELRSRTHLKLGYFSGPCFVLTANGVLDYFGQTVNVAARLQGQAHSGELVLEAGFADEALRTGALSAGEVVERYEATLKGVERPIELVRIVARAAAPVRSLAAG